MPGKLRKEDIEFPDQIVTKDGILTEFTVTIKNRNPERLYWLSIFSPIESGSRTIFFPPKRKPFLEPGKTKIKCGVSSYSPHINPNGGREILSLQIMTAFNEPVQLNIPVAIQTPTLEILETRLQKDQDSRILLVKVANNGDQDLDTKTDFNSSINERKLKQTGSVERINSGQTEELSFPIPEDFEIGKTPQLTLSAVKLAAPVHRWHFPKTEIRLPTPPWILYALLILTSGICVIAIHFLRLFLHPLTISLSKNPESLLQTPLEQLPLADRLLIKTRKKQTVLSACDIHTDILKAAIAFSSVGDPDRKAAQLINRIGKQIGGLTIDGIRFFRFRPHSAIMLNIEDCLMAFAPDEIPASTLIDTLKHIEGIRFVTCIIISLDTKQRDELRKHSKDTGNWFVTPDSRDLAEWLLSPNPTRAFSKIVASQIDLSRISPYQTHAGVARSSVFFGRDRLLAHILQREPANYLVVGGRQVGKSSLLKEIERRCIKNNKLVCHYMLLTGSDLIGYLAHQFKLNPGSGLNAVVSHIRNLSESEKHLFLIDEADRFIEAEAKTDYETLHEFRGLSEEGRCFFILAGFWSLHRCATFDYQSPIKNFGETMQIGALEPEASRMLATLPLSHLNLRFESDAAIKNLLEKTGRRANLIAIVCNEIIKSPDIAKRIITLSDIEDALYGEAVQSALAGWGHIYGTDERANRLDRIILYAGIGMDPFSQQEIMEFLHFRNCPYDPEEIRQALARLELAFILKQKRMNWSFRVPILKEMIRKQGPENMLEMELKMLA